MPENYEAWEVWMRVQDQYVLHWIQVSKEEKKLKRFRFIQESVWPIIHAVDPVDPLFLFDKVIAIEQEFSSARR